MEHENAAPSGHSPCTSASPNNRHYGNSETNSSESDSDDEATVPSHFTRKISTNKRLHKSVFIKEGYLQILRSTSFNKWKKRYFWLKGKTLFYGRDKQADIFEEIDVALCTVAEYTLKNINHAFQVITSFRNFVLATESRKEMESWIQAIIFASRERSFDRIDQQSMISGYHSWYITSHARPVFCNVCKEALQGVTSHGLSCGVCRFKSHKLCANRAPPTCKWSTLASIGKHIIEDPDGSIDMEHQWMEGNIPVGTLCTVCDKKCGSVKKLVDERCLWCKAVVHTACKDQLPKRCQRTICQYSVMAPMSVQSIDSDGMCEANRGKCRVTFPLLVFVNSKSGDNHGVKFLRKFKQLLNPAQVFDLMNGGPNPGLRLFQNFDQFRILICGGDGSIGWVMSEIDRLNLHSKCQIGVLPLGTGNDLARVLGWGSVMTDDKDLANVIDKLEQSQIKMLDRWSIQCYGWKQPKFLFQSNESVDETATDLSLQQELPTTISDSLDSEESSLWTFESSMAECLHKILSSNDNLTVINHSKSLCMIVNRFLSHLMSLEKLSNSANEKTDLDSPLSDKCHILHAKLDKLVDALNDTKVLADQCEPLPSAQQSDEPVDPSGSGVMEDKPPSNKVIMDPEQCTEKLMSRANSVKKAIKQIMDHTDAAVTMTISSNVMPSANSTQSHSKADLSVDTVSTETSACEGEVEKSLMSNDGLPSHSQDSLSPRRKISAVSTFAQKSGCDSGTNSACSSQSTAKSSSLRVKNSIAHKLEGGGSFISKMLLANADAICAPVVPPFDDEAFLSGFEEKSVMNNYFGIGIDAKINLDFCTQRHNHPERFRSRARNFITFASLGGKEVLTGSKSYRNFEKRIRLECDGQSLPLPNLQGIVILNIPSYSGGTNFWGPHSSASSEPFTAPSFDDKIMEVMAVYSSVDIGVSRFINLQYHYRRIAQCRTVKLTILGDDPVPVHVDGEGWLQNPGFIMISHKNRAQMLTRDRNFENALKSWSERQCKERLLTPTSTHISESQSTGLTSASPQSSSGDADLQMQKLVQVTRELVDCIRSMHHMQITPNKRTLNKCGEFISLDDATQAGLQELLLCSTELCSEVQDLLLAYSSRSTHEAESKSLQKLRAALLKTQEELERFNQQTRVAPVTHQKHRYGGPFSKIGKLMRIRRRSSATSNKNASSLAEAIVKQWSTTEVGTWLNTIGLGEYSRLFVGNDIRGVELLQLQRQDFKDLGITKVGHVKRLQSALKSQNLGRDSSS